MMICFSLGAACDFSTASENVILVGFHCSEKKTQKIAEKQSLDANISFRLFDLPFPIPVLFLPAHTCTLYLLINVEVELDSISS